MCLIKNTVNGKSRHNYDGGKIIHECIVPSARLVVDENVPYDIDAREFLATQNQEVMKRVLEREIKDYITRVGIGSWELFKSREPGSFDYRVDIVTSFISKYIEYEPKKARDPWLFPDETLRIRKGDCEDIALLLASLIIASGVSNYNIRVALGKVVHFENDKRKTVYDHMWVVYKNERGHWILLDPMIVTKRGIRKRKTKEKFHRKTDSVSYQPQFVWNNDHLWQLGEEEKQFKNNFRKAWKKLDPHFAGEVHKTIIATALATKNESLSHIRHALLQRFRPALWPIVNITVDDEDRNFFKYDPRDHFDNGYIAESWERVYERIENAKEVRTSNYASFIDSIAAAFHAISDFYAHSTYMHFQKLNPGDIPKVYVGQGELKGANYSNGEIVLGSNKFPPNGGLWDETDFSEAFAHYKDQIISGRYAQHAETYPDTKFPEGWSAIPRKLKREEKFYLRATLPHHNQIAVDEESPESTHCLYSSSRQDPRLNYKNQYEWRTKAAIKHIQTVLIKEFGFVKADFENPHV